MNKLDGVMEGETSEERDMQIDGWTCKEESRTCDRGDIYVNRVVSNHPLSARMLASKEIDKSMIWDLAFQSYSIPGVFGGAQ